MTRNTSVQHIMSANPVTVGPLESLLTIRDMFEVHPFHHFPVVNDGELVGLLSYTDYLRVVRHWSGNSTEQYDNHKMLSALIVRDVMTANVLSLHPEDTVQSALLIFRSNKIHALPVINDDRKLLGIVTPYDMLLILDRILSEQESLHWAE